MRADRAPAVQGTVSEMPSNIILTGQPRDTQHEVNEQIILPHYARASHSEHRCFISYCQGVERHRVPHKLRVLLLKSHNIYVSENNRLCSIHLRCTEWDFLNESRYTYQNSFTANEIQDMMTLLKTDYEPNVDFENIESMPDHLVHYWLGKTKEQYRNILEEVTQINTVRRGRAALTAYLIKLRTGDSNARLSSLMKIPKRTLGTLLSKARDIMYQYYVPQHIGLNHISRQQIAEKNLLIPKGLFSNENGTRPVVIMDGTYIYVQKSSNYSYQKSTYSLHKYRNLVKTFLIVTTDGYIVEVLGPYPATTSDADIVKKEFENENQPLRNYFHADDAFILDRGFRDALPLLSECGYHVHRPEDVKEGETQLTTIDANKSRAVTICRWVVEVVNGRFKRDFKIFRQDYYNSTSQNIIKDFKVAAALINAFHPLIENRGNAETILTIIRRNMNVENTLAEAVLTLNLNRRRTNFTEINVENNNLSDFPQLTSSELELIPLGTYQIKQARSYYGEHIRENGRYAIEVCREVPSSLLGELSTQNTWLLRGRIKSRHTSRKMYFVYILVDNSQTGRNAITKHYCNCIVGKRTVGCCAHVMTIIWYLSWARYQPNITPPAQHLDSILL